MKKIFSFCLIALLLLSFVSCQNEEEAYIGTFKTSEWAGDLIYTFTFNEDHSGTYKESFTVGETEFEQRTQKFSWRVSNGELHLAFEGEKEEVWYYSLKNDTFVIAINGVTQTFYRTDETGKINPFAETVE